MRVTIPPPMQRAGEIIGKAIARTGDPRAANSWCEASWSALVGKTLATHTRPSSCQGGLLSIEVDSPPWQKQVGEMGQEICRRVNRAWGGTLVRSVKVELARSTAPRMARAVDNDHLPFLRRSRTKSS